METSTSTKKLISKTDYLVWRDCAHNAWMKKWKPEIYFALPPSEFDRHLIETGNHVEEKVREHESFKNGVLLEGRDAQAIEKTAELLKNKTELLYQACFSDSTLFAAIDILRQGKDGELYIYEVKASNASLLNTEDKRDPKKLAKYEKELLGDEHLFDLAFQVYLAREVGHKVEEAFLVRLNKDYTRGVNLNIEKLFVVEPVLEYVDKILPAVEKEIKNLIKTLSSPEKPHGPCDCIYKGRSNHCTTFAENNKGVLKKEELEYGVHDISRIGNSKQKLQELVDSGVYNILDIPADFELSEKMLKQVDVHKRGSADIDHEAIREQLSKLQFPLYFLDYESFNPAIPRFVGFKPYQHIPFQFSLDRLDAPDGKLIHEEFLYTEKGDPTSLFVKKLEKHIGKVGSIIVWNKTFEESHINKHIAVRLPEYADFITGINSRIFDLMKIFSEQLHIHPEFYGSASIKNVLPVLCPELSYKELDIGNGSEAMNTWNKIVTGEISENEIKTTEKAMLEYCALDTYAMYAIWKHLCEII